MMQTSLFNYQEERENKNTLYEELKKIGYVDNHKMSILQVLWDLKSHQSNEVVNAGGKQYNARILELRREGWNIISERSINNSFFFRLLSHTKREI